MHDSAHGSVGVTHVHGTLVVTVTSDLGEGVMDAVRKAALEGAHREGTSRVVLDLTAVPFIDLAEFDAIRRIARSIELVGATTTLVGLRPGIIMHLVESGADTAGIRATLGLAEALGGATGTSPDA